METLLAGWVAVEEGDRLSEYTIHLLAECRVHEDARCDDAHQTR